MKDKMILFIIGLLVGAVISTGAFFVYTKSTCNTNNNNQMQMPGGTPPSQPNGQSGQNVKPPEKPGDNNTQSSNTQDSN